MQRLWFAAKRYGYGWYPVTWEGWVCLIVYMLLLLSSIPFLTDALESGTNTASAVAIFLVWDTVITALLITICVKKGEKAKWRWGK